MIVERFHLREDNPAVTVTAYILDESSEFRNGLQRPTVIICPGGGYLFCSDREAEPVAMTFLRKGFNAFVLRYTVGEDGKRTKVYRDALKDLGDTILLVKNNAKKWNIDVNKLILTGFSAGGHLCASMSSLWKDEDLKAACNISGDELRTSAAILGYPLTSMEVMVDKIAKMDNVPDWMSNFIPKANIALMGTPLPNKDEQYTYSPISFVNSETVPTYIWHTSTDGLVFAEQALRYALSLDQCSVPYELHVFGKGEHGLSVADETIMRDKSDICEYCQPWIDMAFHWLNEVVWKD